MNVYLMDYCRTITRTRVRKRLPENDRNNRQHQLTTKVKPLTDGMSRIWKVLSMNIVRKAVFHSPWNILKNAAELCGAAELTLCCRIPLICH